MSAEARVRDPERSAECRPCNGSGHEMKLPDGAVGVCSECGGSGRQWPDEDGDHA